MAQRVVKLQPDKPAPGPAIRLRRSKPGESSYAFLVGYVDEKGAEDFRTLEEHADYDVALKAAQDRAHRLRIPTTDTTGAEPETKVEKPGATKRRAVTRSSVEPSTNLDDLPSLASNFDLPSIDQRLETLDTDVIAKRVEPMLRAARDEYLAIHSQCFGDSRNHPVSYTQRTHDQIQGQIQGLYGHLLTVQAILYCYLEAAFKRIHELERKSLTVDSFDAQVADDDRTIELSFGTGDEQRVASFKWPVPIYRGTHKAGQQYDAGDMVSHQGSGWIAQRPTSATPGIPNSGFQLAIKRGKDAKP